MAPSSGGRPRGLLASSRVTFFRDVSLLFHWCSLKWRYWWHWSNPQRLPHDGIELTLTKESEHFGHDSRAALASPRPSAHEACRKASVKTIAERSGERNNGVRKMQNSARPHLDTKWPRTHLDNEDKTTHARVCVWVDGRELIGPWQRHVSMTAKRSIHRHLRKHRRQKCQVARQVLPRPVCPRTKCAGHLRRSAWPQWNPADEQCQKYLGKWRRHSTNAICGAMCARKRTTAAFRRCSHSLCYEKRTQLAQSSIGLLPSRLNRCHRAK